MSLKVISAVQFCDAGGCNAQRMINPDERQSRGWEFRNDVSGITVDLCPDHSKITTMRALGFNDYQEYA